MSGRKVLITGGFGNLGSWISDYFSNNGYKITILSKSIKESEYSTIQADISNFSDLNNKLKDLEFDYIIHTASYNEFFHKKYYQKALLVNTLGTRNLIEILKNRDIKKFIYLSTFHIYGVDSGTVTENTPPNPKNDYASTHLFAEYYLKQFNSFPSTIFRLTNSYGSPKSIDSSKWYLVLNDLARSAFLDKKIVLKGNGKAVRDFIYMGDVCKVIEKSFKFKSNSILNLSSNRSYSMLYLAKKVQLVYKRKYNKELEIILNENDKTETKLLSVDNSKLMSLTNIEFSNRFEEEIEKIFNLLERYYG